MHAGRKVRSDMKRQDWLDLFNRHKLDLERIVIKFRAATFEEWMKAVKEQKPEDLGAILQRAWDNAPDKPWIHEIPSWGVLCDLCSDYCFGGIE